jgi:ankyrin repeat protein
MRVSRAPSANEGKTALHVAAESGKTDLVRYLLEKGANTRITDAGGKKPIDLLAASGGGASAAAPNTASAAEIRSLLEKSAAGR